MPVHWESSIAQPKERPEYYGQKRSLVPLKKEREWYSEIHSQVLQDHECPHCGASMPRDLNSGILIKKVGLGVASFKNAKSRKRDGEARANCVA